VQWWRSPQWRSLVEHAEDPSSARLALAAAAHEINFIGNGMDREYLAKACEEPAVVLAFHSVGDDQSYPLWASDSIDTWESNTKALVAAGIPEPVAVRRAALVFGTTEANRDYLKAASDHTISDVDLMRCADSALASELAQYAVEPVAKVSPIWDESSVNRDNLGQFAEKDKLSEEEEQGHSFQIIGGAKYSIRERVRVREQEEAKPEKVAERKTTDQQLLAQDKYAEARRAKAAAKEKKLKRMQKLSRLNAVAQQAERQRALEAERARQAEAAKVKAAERATPRGRVKEAVEQRQRSRAKLRMGRKERTPAVFDPGDNLPPLDVGDLTNRAYQDAQDMDMGLGLNHDPVVIRSHEKTTDLSTGRTSAFPFKNPGVNLVADSKGDDALVADIGIYLEHILETAQKNVDRIADDAGGMQGGRYSDETVVDMAVYTQALYNQAMTNLTQNLLNRPGAKGEPWATMYFALHADQKGTGTSDLLLIPIGMLDVNSDDPPIDVSNDGRVTIKMPSSAGTVYQRKVNSAQDFNETSGDEYVMTYGKDGMITSTYKPIGKAWDESSVNRNELGQFADEDEEQVVNGARVRVRVQRERPGGEKVRFASTPPAKAGAERRIRQAKLRTLEERRQRASTRERPQEQLREAKQIIAQEEAREERRRSHSSLTMSSKPIPAHLRGHQTKEEERVETAETKSFNEHLQAELAAREAQREAAKVAEKVQVKEKLQERVSLAELSQHRPQVRTREANREQERERERARSNERVAARVRALRLAQEKAKETPKPKAPRKPFVLPSGNSALTELMIKNPNFKGASKHIVVNDADFFGRGDNLEDVIGGSAEPGHHGDDAFFDRMILSEGRDIYTGSSWYALKEPMEAIDSDDEDETGPQEIEIAGSGTYDDPYEVSHTGRATKRVTGSYGIIHKAHKRLMLKRR
jgi:hypothetical protein